MWLYTTYLISSKSLLRKREITEDVNDSDSGLNNFQIVISHFFLNFQLALF